MEELEKNYGIYLDVDTFIKDMNKQLKEITNYHDFFEYIGSDFGKDMNDLDILIHCYKKAKEKKYIRGNFSGDLNLSQSFRAPLRSSPRLLSTGHSALSSNDPPLWPYSPGPTATNRELSHLHLQTVYSSAPRAKHAAMRSSSPPRCIPR